MQIIYRPQNEQPPRKGDWICDRVQFQPGPNQVDAKTYARLQKLSAFQAAVELGAIVLPVDAVVHDSDPEPVVVEVIDPTKSDAELPRVFTSLSSMTVAESEPLIQKTTDLEQLNYWLEESSRKTLTELLEDRIAELSPTD